MGTYEAPTGAEMRGYTRLKGGPFELSDEELEAALEDHRQEGEDDVFGRIGATWETRDDLDARQLRQLKRAVAHRTAAGFLWELLTDRVSGEYAPQLMADPDTIGTLAAANEGKAKEQESLLRAAGEVVDTEPAFALPVSASGTFAVDSTDPTPMERNDLVDERDGRSSWDDP